MARAISLLLALACLGMASACSQRFFHQGRRLSAVSIGCRG